MQVKGFGCLHYALTQSVYFLVPSEGRHNDYFLMACVFLMQPLGMSTLCRDSDCLLYAKTWTVFFVQSPWVIKKTMCLLYDFTQTVYFLMACVYTMMAYQVEAIFHLKSVYTLPWPKVSTLCMHEDLVVYIMMWHWVSTFWCHQRVDKVSTFWWHMSSLSSHLSSLWCHQTMSTFWSHAKCLPCEASPFCITLSYLYVRCISQRHMRG